ncbi:restriction endonuclease subunit S [Enterococcus durans]|uniref:restriction endonuclease subunit S n=1 Tax=Enterococcus durans TaxID=53345 RepID=UPI0011BDC85B|nr:restriction endonuclease subunit S [Enterococcus durans]QED59446.1 restriction endonuclease subunit S [Enterococcus durans]QED61880.1 restriction endonuclease subunit S [Enterococcus durans]
MSNDTRPEIRFPGFTEAWEQSKLGEVIDVQSGRDYKHLNPGNIPVYGTGGYMLSVDKALSTENDAIGIGRKGTIDKPYILKSPFWTVDTLFYAIPRQNYDIEFLYSIFQRINWKSKDESTGVPSLSKTTINSVSVYLPNSKEQQKIGTFFKQLDETIALHQRKLDLLKETKKGFLQKMFPKNGAKVPEIRFPGFTGDWEQRKLASMTNYKNGKGHEDKQSTIGKLELINLNSISISGGLKHSGKFIDEADDTLQKDDLVMILSDVGHGDLLGRVALIPEDGRFVLNQRVALLRPNATADPQFLFSYINAHQYYFKAQGAGMSQLNISKGSVENFISFVPIIEEQKKIGTFFKQLDDTIALHQRKLDLLKETKKGFLQKMFV